MSAYKRLSFQEREEISRLLNTGESLRYIAASLGRNVSTISREINRLSSGKNDYRALSGQNHSIRQARSRRQNKRKLFENPKLLKVVRSKLKIFWSPDQIAKYLKATYDCPSMHISAESIYTYIYILPRGELRDELSQQLREKHIS